MVKLTSTIILAIGVSLLLSVAVLTQNINLQQSSAQSNASSMQLKNFPGNATDKKTYILIFGQRIIGNIDNSTKIVSSIVGNNLTKIKEEFLEEVSLSPSPPLKLQIEKIVDDGINGSCESTLTISEERIVSVVCISSGNEIIWYMSPTN